MNTRDGWIKGKIIRTKQLQKKYNVNCKINTVITLDENGKLHNILAEIQEKIGFKITTISLSKGYISGIIIDKKHPILQ